MPIAAVNVQPEAMPSGECERTRLSLSQQVNANALAGAAALNDKEGFTGRAIWQPALSPTWGKDWSMAKTSEPTQLQLITSTRFIPAHLAVQQGICSWCGAPVEIEEARPGHIRVPNCGCVKVQSQE